MQKGQVFRRSGSWYLRYYRDEFEDGRPVRRRVCERLARCSDDYRSKRDLQPLIQPMLYPVNSGDAQPEAAMTITEFAEKRYFPSRLRKLTPSTIRSYTVMYKNHVKNRVGHIRLRDFHTKDAQHLFDKIAADFPELAHETHLRTKAVLSAIFTYARQEDALRGINPLQGVKVEGRRYRPVRKAYTLEDIQTMLALLPEPARTIVIVAAFTGLRESELRGLRWEDYSGDELIVRRSVWRTHVGPTKTEASGENPVPVISIVRTALDAHRKLHGGDGYIFAGERKGTPLHLDNLSRRVIAPALNGGWKGWHGFRRGLASNLYRLGVPAKIIQDILRHADVSTTQANYIIVDRSETQAAMRKLERAVGKTWAKAKKTPKPKFPVLNQL